MCQSQVVPGPGGCAGGWEVLGSAQVSREKSKQELTSHVHPWEKIQGSPAPQAGGSWIKSSLPSGLLSFEHSCPWDCSCQCFYCGMPLSSSEMVSLGSSHAKCSPAQRALFVFFKPERVDLRVFLVAQRYHQFVSDFGLSFLPEVGGVWPEDLFCPL